MGVLSRLKNLFFKLLDFLASLDIAVVDEGTDENGNPFQVCERTINGKVYKYRRTVIEDEKNKGKIILSYASADGKKDGFQITDVTANPTPEQIIACDQKYFEKLGVSKEDFYAKEETAETSETEEKTATASKNIKVTLKKIQSSENTDSIQLNRFCANYDVPSAMNDLAIVLDNAEFVDTLTEEPQSFIITDGEEDFDVEPIYDDFGVDSQYENLMLSTLVLLASLQTVHWKAAGEDFFQLHEKLDEYIQDCRDQVDAIAELSMECTGDVTNPILLTRSLFDDARLGFVDIDKPLTGFYTIEDGFASIRNDIDEHITRLEAYYPNFDHDIQSELDTWIRKWKKVSRYFLTRQQMK